MSGSMKITRTGLTRAGVDLSAAALFGLFGWAHWVGFWQHPRPSLALVVVAELITACLFVARRPPDRTSHAPWDWITAVGGTFSPLLLRPAPVASDVLVGEAIQVAGTLLTVLAFLSLSRSLGVVPAHRGVRTGGLYRWVRHPLYMSYALSHLGYVISNCTYRNVLLALASLGLQLLRIGNEERFLSAYPDYREYQTHTRWKIFPTLY